MTTKPKKKKSVPYEQELYKDLRNNQDEAVEYLSAALEDPDEPELFLVALRHVAEAWGFGHMAEITGLNRESLYKMLSEKGNPKLSSLMTLLDGMGLRLAVIKK
jgi:probable addiction module antidote protein